MRCCWKGRGLQWEIETYSAHNRTLANNVTLTNVYAFNALGIVVLSNDFNGSFVIDSIDPGVPSKKLRFTLLSSTGESNPGGSAAAIGVNFNALVAAGGTTAVIECNRVYGATHGEHNDTGSSRDFAVRNNYFSDVVLGVFHSLGNAGETSRFSSLTASGTTAKLTTFSPHGLLPRSAVLVSGAKVGTVDSPLYNGYFEISPVLGDATSFTYQMTGIPNANSDTTNCFYVEYLRIRRVVIENNVIELSSAAPPNPPSFGVLLADFNNDSVTTLSVYLQAIIRRNCIRKVDDLPDGNSAGISLAKSEHAVIEENVIDPAITTPLYQRLSGAFAYFDNTTPSGQVRQGLDGQTGRLVDELTTRLDDAFVFSI